MTSVLCKTPSGVTMVTQNKMEKSNQNSNFLYPIPRI